MFNLTTKQNKQTIQQINMILGYLVIGALVVTTAVHAISLVISETQAVTGVMGLIRVASPVLLEGFAAVCAIGFFTNSYKGGQRVWATAVEVVWVAFAALNLVTSFTLESGEPLPGVLWVWLHYGLPLSALIGGVLFYVVLRVDPDKLRANEQKAAQEEHEQLIFEAKLAVVQSDQMKQVLQNQAWLGVVSRMQADGYTPDQISYMMQSVPNLLNSPAHSQPVTEPLAVAKPVISQTVASDVVAPSPEKEAPPAIQEPASVPVVVPNGKQPEGNV